MKYNYEGAKVSLVVLSFNPNDDMPWTVEDQRLRKKYHCPTKADVLLRVSEILNNMQMKKEVA